MRNFIIFVLALIFGIVFVNAIKESFEDTHSKDVQKISEKFVEKPVEKIPKEKIVNKVPIIMYHYVREVDKNTDLLGWNLSINPADFEKQLNYLKENGYKTIHLSDLISGNVAEKSIVLTFDDGLTDFYTTALPLLQKYGFTASNGIITEMVEAWEHMTEDQIKKCVDAGIEITSHSLNHPDMASLAETEAKRQLTESRDYLKNKFGVDVIGFVYPSGKYSDLVVKILGEEGYKIAITTEYGEADLANDNMLLLPRIRIDNRDSYSGFVKKLENLE